MYKTPFSGSRTRTFFLPALASPAEDPLANNESPGSLNEGRIKGLYITKVKKVKSNAYPNFPLIYLLWFLCFSIPICSEWLAGLTEHKIQTKPRQIHPLTGVNLMCNYSGGITNF